MTTQVIGSGIKGGIAGYKVGGVYGAIAGAVVGIFGGAQADKADKYRRQAKVEEQRAIEIQQAQQRRGIVRSVFLARSESLAAAAAQEGGGLQGSASRGALSAVGTQGISNLKFFDALIARQIMEAYYTKRAGKTQAGADLVMGLIDSVGGGGGGGMGGMFGGGGSKSSSSSSSSSGGYSGDIGGS